MALSRAEKIAILRGDVQLTRQQKIALLKEETPGLATQQEQQFRAETAGPAFEEAAGVSAPASGTMAQQAGTEGPAIGQIAKSPRNLLEKTIFPSEKITLGSALEPLGTGARVAGAVGEQLGVQAKQRQILGLPPKQARSFSEALTDPQQGLLEPVRTKVEQATEGLPGAVRTPIRIGTGIATGVLEDPSTLISLGGGTLRKTAQSIGKKGVDPSLLRTKTGMRISPAQATKDPKLIEKELRLQQTPRLSKVPEKLQQEQRGFIQERSGQLLKESGSTAKPEEAADVLSATGERLQSALQRAKKRTGEQFGEIEAEEIMPLKKTKLPAEAKTIESIPKGELQIGKKGIVHKLEKGKENKWTVTSFTDDPRKIEMQKEPFIRSFESRGDAIKWLEDNVPPTAIPKETVTKITTDASKLIDKKLAEKGFNPGDIISEKFDVPSDTIKKALGFKKDIEQAENIGDLIRIRKNLRETLKKERTREGVYGQMTPGDVFLDDIDTALRNEVANSVEKTVSKEAAEVLRLNNQLYAKNREFITGLTDKIPVGKNVNEVDIINSLKKLSSEDIFKLNQLAKDEAFAPVVKEMRRGIFENMISKSVKSDGQISPDKIVTQWNALKKTYGKTADDTRKLKDILGEKLFNDMEDTIADVEKTKIADLYRSFKSGTPKGNILGKEGPLRMIKNAADAITSKFAMIGVKHYFDKGSSIPESFLNALSTTGGALTDPQGLKFMRKMIASNVTLRELIGNE